MSRWTNSSGFFSALRRWAQAGAARHEAEPLGLRGEKLAAKYLRRKGYRILEHSHRQRRGEIDLIALHKKCIVFVEVKTWRSGTGGDPSEAVDLRKQKRLTRAALIYLKEKRVLDQPARFDVISIVWPESSEPTIRHFESAFEATGNGQLYG
ncbi:MAG: YraN family protein [Planctomycetota bacterium]